MGLSIITPHYNNLDGLKSIFTCLQTQTSSDWEWIVVDDYSARDIIVDLKKWFKRLEDKNVKLICNTHKTTGSLCRNMGVDASNFNRLVFLDSDDLISPNFVANRQLDIKDFAVFGNYQILYQKEVVESKELIKSWNFLDRFLSAQFLWQTTCILWNRDFFISIGQYHPELLRLQDVELTIRALQKSTNYSVVDNSVDFYYQVKPIRERKNFVKPVCDSVYLFAYELLNTSSLTKNQLSLVSGYYYLCVKYFERSESLTEVAYVKRNLNMFYKKGYIPKVNYALGVLSLQLYTYGLFSGKFFLRVNRYLFKP
jgi:glycosyltransferase involved in cell wall biosynthesis